MPKKKTEPTRSAIDAVRQAQSAKQRKLVIKEWGDLEMWFGPITIADLEAIEKREPRSSHERNIILLIHKARDKDGKPLFQMGDLHYLKTEADWTILNPIFAFMFESVIGAGDVEEAKSELGETKASAGDSN